MKKYTVLSTLLAGVTLFSVGCNRSRVDTHEPDVTIPNAETVERTDHTLVENGASAYKIVIPDSASDRVEFAAEELQYFFSLATGVTLPIVSDRTVSDVDGKYLSVGDTRVSRAAVLEEVKNGTVGKNGYEIETNGEAIAMSGATDDGTVFSVYGYLKKQFHLEIYAENTFTYDTVKTDNLVNLDWKDVPDIAVRTGGTYLANDSSVALSRYRQTAWSDGWGLWGHSHFSVLPPATYYSSHKDWYKTDSNGNPAQLAWDNTEMQAQFTENLKEIILSKPDCSYFMLGQQDNTVKGAEPGTYYSGYTKKEYPVVHEEIYFLNNVVNKINVWKETACPDRELKFFIFAYQNTLTPPIISGTGAKTEAKLTKNLGVMIAPIHSPVSYGYMDATTNADAKAAFEGWKAALGEGGEITVWSYSTNFRDFVAPFNSWGSIKANMQSYKEMGVTFLAEQGTVNAKSACPNFMELRQYLLSQLSWDSSLDTEVLILKFMQAYYGAGWEEVYEYFNLLRNRMVELETKTYTPPAYQDIGSTATWRYLSYCNWDETPEYFDANLFSKGFLEQGEALFQQALADAKADGDEAAVAAIQKDHLSLRYLLLGIYPDAYDAETYVKMVYEFRDTARQIHFTHLNESASYRVHTVDGLIAQWLANVA